MAVVVFRAEKNPYSHIYRHRPRHRQPCTCISYRHLRKNMMQINIIIDGILIQLDYMLCADANREMDIHSTSSMRMASINVSDHVAHPHESVNK